VKWLHDLESQLIWGVVGGGAAIRCWQLDAGTYGNWFWISLAPFGFVLSIISRWVGKENGPTFWQLLKNDSRLEKWPKLKKVLNK
jgi:hypothetical protein